MKKVLMILAATTAFVATTVSAETVTSLPQLNGTRGDGVATTTTTASGTRTTVVGSGGDANRAYAPPVANTWIQSAVGAGGTVGITTDYARSGTGSAFFSTTNADSKGDLQYYFSAPVALASLSSISYDFFRDASSTTAANFAPVLRMDIRKDGAFAGSLVYEYIYQNQMTPPVGSWTTLSGDLNNGIFWATNANLGPTFANGNGGQKTLSSWLADNSASVLTVSGLSIGVGSGWNGTFSGAIDNVNVAFNNGPTYNANFEVPAANGAVPEPATWAMMILGMGAVGFAMRSAKRRSNAKFDAKIKAITAGTLA